MIPNRCPKCNLLFPLDIEHDVRITIYCGTISHWQKAGISLEVCTRNISYLLGTFVPLTAEERAADALFRRMLSWLEQHPWT
jgi:hypothetical protein